MSDEPAPSLRAAIGFRSVLVHGYSAVDVGIVSDVIEHRLTNIEAFVTRIRKRLDERP